MLEPLKLGPAQIIGFIIGVALSFGFLLAPLRIARRPDQPAQ